MAVIKFPIVDYSVVERGYEEVALDHFCELEDIGAMKRIVRCNGFVILEFNSRVYIRDREGRCISISQSALRITNVADEIAAHCKDASN